MNLLWGKFTVTKQDVCMVHGVFSVNLFLWKAFVKNSCFIVALKTTKIVEYLKGERERCGEYAKLNTGEEIPLRESEKKDEGEY